MRLADQWAQQAQSCLAGLRDRSAPLVPAHLEHPAVLSDRLVLRNLGARWVRWLQRILGGPWVRQALWFRGALRAPYVQLPQMGRQLRPVRLVQDLRGGHAGEGP